MAAGGQRWQPTQDAVGAVTSAVPVAPGELAPQLEAPWRQLRLLVGQLAGGFGVLVVVAIALFRVGAGATPAGLTRFVAGAVIASVADIAAIPIVLRRHLQGSARAEPDGRSAESVVAGRVATAVLIAAALVEAPGLLGVMLTIVGAPLWVLGGLVALSIIGFAMLFPTRSRYSVWAVVAGSSLAAVAHGPL